VAAYCKHGNGILSLSEAEFVEDLGKYWLAESLPLKVVYLYTYLHYSADRSGCKLLLTDRTLCMCACNCEATQNDRYNIIKSNYDTVFKIVVDFLKALKIMFRGCRERNSAWVCTGHKIYLSKIFRRMCYAQHLLE